MGKRSSFARRPMDAYQTIDPKASRALMPHLHGVRTYAEPCCGEGHLVAQFRDHGLACVYAGDIGQGHDALALTNEIAGYPDAYITNPPWTRKILHALIRHLMHLRPTWLLFDSDWAYNLEACGLIQHCSHIVVVGRLKWIEGSPASGKDNCSWYRFDGQHRDGPRFINKRRSLEGHPHD